MGNGVIVQALANLRAKGRVGVMEYMGNQIDHIDGGHVEDGDGRRHARHHREKNHVTTTPEQAFEQFLDEIHLHAPEYLGKAFSGQIGGG
jgi:hypothetical protein